MARWHPLIGSVSDTDDAPSLPVPVKRPVEWLPDNRAEPPWLPDFPAPEPVAYGRTLREIVRDNAVAALRRLAARLERL